jgi:hypothetical protein
MNRPNSIKKISLAIATIAVCAYLFSCTPCKIDTKLSEETSKVTDVASNKATIYTDIVINAPASKVWTTLTDFDKMPNWSSTIKGISGEFRNGGTVVVKVDVGNGQVIDVPRSPLLHNEGESFGWSGEIKRLPGLSDNHKYKVEAISKCQSRFIQTEEFTGINPNITPIVLANQVKERYKTFNKELKKEVEKN